ncbi:Rix1 complex component [Phyllosticta citribraziliensis]|uniref:Pre-rRNA-processing protein n=1 Tax=Phyllosticta citribraziliensis TaxID=989973 RepID=A0ABR1LP69_9PEZI
MGSSSKKKKEKQKDFQKPKLKVGKAKPKADNFTDTSFKAKSIVVKSQSIHTTPQGVVAECAHYLGLLSHKTDTQRREALAYLTGAINTARAQNVPLPQPVSVIIPKAGTLIYDNAKSVREQLLKLLQVLPPNDVKPYVEDLVLRTRAGMTSLSMDIRLSSLDVLDWLLKSHPEDTVSCAGGWVHTLKCFNSTLGFREPVSSSAPQKWSTAASTVGASHSDSEKLKKLRAHQLTSLATFLRTGIVEDPEEKERAKEEADRLRRQCFPLHQAYHHMHTPQNAFDHLNLFGAPPDEDNRMYTDRHGRQRAFAKLARPALENGLKSAKKEGGMVGRAAAEVEKVVQEGMHDFDDDDVSDYGF